jgi:hypothetical protein
MPAGKGELRSSKRPLTHRDRRELDPCRRKGRHYARRRKGQANQDPGMRYGNPPGGVPRHPDGSKLFVGIVGGSRGFVKAELKFRGKRPDKNNPASHPRQKRRGRQK